MNVIFPVPEPNLQLRYGALPEGEEAYVIIGMFTASHCATVQRLLTSLDQFSLPYALYEVPSVHRSISPKGLPDLSYTKANFIWHVLQQARRPVLYLDVDTVIRKPPVYIEELVAAGRDFAILNWLALDSNDAFIPISVTTDASAGPTLNRFYRFSHSIDIYDPGQIICSGAAQLWGTTPAAADLLKAWHTTVATHPGVADDQCLDFAFNNRLGDWPKTLRPTWLPKSYARYAWWIFDEPVIDHPDFPYSGNDWLEIIDQPEARRFFPGKASPRSNPPISRDLIIDSESGQVFRVENQSLVWAGQLSSRIWRAQP